MSITFHTPINKASTTIASTHTIGDGILQVNDATPFGSPSSTSPVRVLATRKSDKAYAIFSITAVSGNSLTIGSVLENTSDITLNANDNVDVDITAGSFQEIHNAINNNCALLNNGVVPTANLGAGTPKAGYYVDGGTGEWTSASKNLPTLSSLGIPVDGTTDASDALETLINSATNKTYYNDGTLFLNRPIYWYTNQVKIVGGKVQTPGGNYFKPFLMGLFPTNADGTTNLSSSVRPSLSGLGSSGHGFATLGRQALVHQGGVAQNGPWNSTSSMYSWKGVKQATWFIRLDTGTGNTIPASSPIVMIGDYTNDAAIWGFFTTSDNTKLSLVLIADDNYGTRKFHFPINPNAGSDIQVWFNANGTDGTFGTTGTIGAIVNGVDVSASITQDKTTDNQFSGVGLADKFDSHQFMVGTCGEAIGERTSGNATDFQLNGLCMRMSAVTADPGSYSGRYTDYTQSDLLFYLDTTTLYTSNSIPFRGIRIYEGAKSYGTHYDFAYIVDTANDNRRVDHPALQDMSVEGGLVLFGTDYPVFSGVTTTNSTNGLAAVARSTNYILSANDCTFDGYFNAVDLYSTIGVINNCRFQNVYSDTGSAISCTNVIFNISHNPKHMIWHYGLSYGGNSEWVNALIDNEGYPPTDSIFYCENTIDSRSLRITGGACSSVASGLPLIRLKGFNGYPRAELQIRGFTYPTSTISSIADIQGPVGQWFGDVQGWLTSSTSITGVGNGIVVNAKRGPYFYPEEYGAAADGATDDTTSLNNAISAANGGGVVVLGQKTYGVKTQLDGTKSNVIVQGSGPQTILKKLTGDSNKDGMLFLQPFSGWKFRDLTIDDNLEARNVADGSTGFSVFLEYGHDITFERVTFMRCNGLRLQSMKNVRFINCTFLGVAPGEVQTGTWSPMSTVSHPNNGSYFRSGVSFSNCEDLIFDNPYFHFCAYGIQSFDVAPSISRRIKVNNPFVRADYWDAPSLWHTLSSPTYTGSGTFTVADTGLGTLLSTNDSSKHSGIVIRRDIVTGTGYSFSAEVLTISGDLSSVKAGDVFETADGYRAWVDGVDGSGKVRLGPWESCDTYLPCAAPTTTTGNWRISRRYGAYISNYNDADTVTFWAEPKAHICGERIFTDAGLSTSTVASLPAYIHSGLAYSNFYTGDGIDGLEYQGGLIRGCMADSFAVQSTNSSSYGVRIIGTRVEYCEDEGGTFNHCVGPVFSGMSFKNVGTSALFLGSSQHATITGCTVEGWGYNYLWSHNGAFTLSSSKYTTITNCSGKKGTGFGGETGTGVTLLNTDCGGTTYVNNVWEDIIYGEFHIENSDTLTLPGDALVIGAKSIVDNSSPSGQWAALVAINRSPSGNTYLGTAAPTTGTYNAGDYVQNTTLNSSTLGWQCTVSGTPGTWVAKTISSSVGIGTNVSSGTANSILFLDGSGNLAQSNPGLTFDGNTLNARPATTGHLPQVWQNSSGSNVAQMDWNGVLQTIGDSSGIQIYNGSSSLMISMDASGHISATSVASNQYILNATSNQWIFYDGLVNGGILIRNNTTGKNALNLMVNSNVGIGADGFWNQQCVIINDDVSYQALLVIGANNQSANIQEWQLNDGTTINAVGSMGNIVHSPLNNNSVGVTVKGTPRKTATVSNVALTSNVATITTSSAHNFKAGQAVAISGLATSDLNATVVIASTPSSTTFTFSLTHADIASTADSGTATVEQIAHLQGWLDSSGTESTYLDKNGNLIINGASANNNYYPAIQLGSASIQSYNAGDYCYISTPQGWVFGMGNSLGYAKMKIGDPTKSFIVQGATSQSGDLLQLQNSTGSVLSKFDSAANLTVPTLTTGSGSTASRPSASTAGTQWYDTTLKRPVWYNGSAWATDTSIVPFSFGGSGTPSVANDVCPWLYVSYAATAVRLTLTCLTAPTGNFTVNILKSSDGGSTFPTTIATVTISSGNRAATTATMTASALSAGDYLRCDITAVNGASTWAARLTALLN